MGGPQAISFNHFITKDIIYPKRKSNIYMPLFSFKPLERLILIAHVWIILRPQVVKDWLFNCVCRCLLSYNHEALQGQWGCGLVESKWCLSMSLQAKPNPLWTCSLPVGALVRVIHHLHASPRRPFQLYIIQVSGGLLKVLLLYINTVSHSSGNLLV